MIVQTVRSDSEDRRSWARLSSAVCQFHAHQPGNCDGKEQWPNNRLQIGEAPCERIDWHDVPITGGRQRGEAEIQRVGDFVRICRRRRSNAGEGIREQLPNQAISRGENHGEVQIKDYRTQKALQCDAAGGIDRMRYHPNQRRERKYLTAVAGDRA